jgi:kojibiose phosphorylase
MASHTVQAFIFDLDGVVTDTAEYHYLSWQQLADEEGIPMDRALGDELRGVSRRDSLMRIIGDRPYTEEQILEMMDRKNRYYVEMLDRITAGDMLPGMESLLHEINDAGLKIGLGSASKNARPVLDRLGITDMFDVIGDGYSVEEHKPDPALFLFAAEQLGVAPANAVVVEDAEAGVEAAVAGGFLSIGIGPADRVGQATIVLDSFEGLTLADVLERLDATAEPPA